MAAGREIGCTSAPAQFASCWRTSNSARALLPTLGALPRSTLAAYESAHSLLEDFFAEVDRVIKEA